MELIPGTRLNAALSADGPDGICADAENAVWYVDIPNKRCVRVREGGELLQTVELNRGCSACALGGPYGATPVHGRKRIEGPRQHAPGAPTRRY